MPQVHSTDLIEIEIQAPTSLSGVSSVPDAETSNYVASSVRISTILYGIILIASCSKSQWNWSFHDYSLHNSQPKPSSDNFARHEIWQHFLICGSSYVAHNIARLLYNLSIDKSQISKHHPVNADIDTII